MSLQNNQLAISVRPQIFIVDSFIIESYPNIADVPYATVSEQRGKTSKPIDTTTPPALQNRCRVCLGHRKGDVLLYCDDCHRAYHQSCVIPVLRDTPKTDWLCPRCRADRVHTRQRTAAAVVSLRNVLADIRDRPSLPLKMQLKLLDVSCPSISFGRAQQQQQQHLYHDDHYDSQAGLDGSRGEMLLKTPDSVLSPSSSSPSSSPVPSSLEQLLSQNERDSHKINGRDGNGCGSRGIGDRDSVNPSWGLSQGQRSVIDNKKRKRKDTAPLDIPGTQPSAATSRPHRSLPPKFRMKAVEAHRSTMKAPAVSFPAASAEKDGHENDNSIANRNDQLAEVLTDKKTHSSLPIGDGPVVLKRVLRAGATKRRRSLSTLAAKLQPLAARLNDGAATSEALHVVRVQLEGGNYFGGGAVVTAAAASGAVTTAAVTNAQIASTPRSMNTGTGSSVGGGTAAAKVTRSGATTGVKSSGLSNGAGRSSGGGGGVGGSVGATTSGTRILPQRTGRGRKRGRGSSGTGSAGGGSASGSGSGGGGNARRDDTRARKRICSEHQARLLGATAAATTGTAVNLRD